MDDQFRNRLRSFDSAAPLRPRPTAPRPQPPVQPLPPARPQMAAPAPMAQPAPQVAYQPRPQPQPKPQPAPLATPAANPWTVSRQSTPAAAAKPVFERPQTATKSQPKSRPKKQKRTGKKK